MLEQLAIDGGNPVREEMLPYGRQSINDSDVDTVVDVLRSDWLTCGPNVAEFEHAFAEFVGVKHAVAVSSGTAALHASMQALGLKSGDEVIVTPITFAASANCICYVGATPVFADVEPDTLLLAPEKVQEKISSRTRAIIAVDYAGQPCNYAALNELGSKHGIPIVADACHSIGGALNGQQVGSLATMSTFSFHPVKNMTTGEGGMVTTNDEEAAKRMRSFRSHGIESDHRQRSATNTFAYEMATLGFNYRITDIQCALGLSQLKRVPGFTEKRQQIAAKYDAAFREFDFAAPLKTKPNASHAYHLYPIRVRLAAGRDRAFAALRAENIGVNVHYLPVYLHPFYKQTFGFQAGHCPVAERAYDELISLPMFPNMTDSDIDDVVRAVRKLEQLKCVAKSGLDR